METVKIFIASSGELKAERDAVFKIKEDLGKHYPHLKLEIVEWEVDNPSGNFGGRRIQEAINPLLEQCAIAFVLFYSRAGEFTVEELHLAEAQCDKVFVYFKSGFSPSDRAESKRYDTVLELREQIEAENRILSQKYDNLTRFELLFKDDLHKHLRDRYPAGAALQKNRDLTLGGAHMALNAIGRVKEIEFIHRQLQSAPIPLTVTGVGGLGKTTLAQMYWQRHRAGYDCAVWLSANVLFTSEHENRADNAENFLRAFLDNMQLKENLNLQYDPQQSPVDHFRQIIAALRDLEGRHLLVIDNTPEAAAEYLPDLCALNNWRILFTSRDHIPNTAKIELDTLSGEEAMALFDRIYEKPAGSEALDQVLDLIGYHTLTIELLAAYARERRLDPSGLLALIRKKGLLGLDDYEVDTPRTPERLDVPAQLRKVFMLELSEAEKEILRYCAILPASNLPLDPALMNEDRLCELFGKTDTEKDFKKRLRRLARLHWLVDKDGAYRCHPVIAETAKAQLLPDALNCAVLIENVTLLLAPDEEKNEPVIARAPWLPLAEAVFKGVWKETGEYGKEALAVADLALRSGWLLDDLGQSSEALRFKIPMVAIGEKVLPAEHPELAVSYNNIALTYYALGDHQKELEYNQKALAIWEKVLPAEHPDLALSYSNIAVTYGALGDHQKRLEYDQKALAIREKVLPAEHPDLARSYNNIAATYGALGEHQKRLEYNQKALAIREKVLPAEHPDLALSYNNIAETYGALDDHQKRLEYHQKALAIREKVLPAEHPDLALSYNNIASTYGALGEHQKRLEYHQKALAIREKVLPAEHPDLAQSYNNIAETYGALGDHQKRSEYHQKALAIWEKVLPAEHPDLALSYSNIAETYGALDEHQKRLEYNRKALAIREKVLPAEHPDLAQSYNNIAVTYYDMGDLEQALHYMRLALTIREKSLPVGHSSTASSKESLNFLEEKWKEAGGIDGVSLTG